MNKISDLIRKSLQEDKAREDAACRALFSAKIKAKAELLCKQDGVICGLDIVKQVFKELDKTSSLKCFLKDGRALTRLLLNNLCLL